MIDTLRIYEELREEISDSAAKKIASAIGRVYNEIVNTVTKEDFRELKQVVEELAEAQKAAEQRIGRVETAIVELAEAQRRTEKRVEELAEAQKAAEQRIGRVETAIVELAEAQKRTEEELKRLIGEHKKTREQLGGLTHTVGYILEDRAYKGLIELLKRDFGVQTLYIKRDYIEVSPNRYEEVNIFGKAIVDEKEIWIIGDCKTQLKKTDIDNFISLAKKIERVLKEDKILVAVTYQTSPSVRKYVQEKGIKLYFSYEMPL